MRLPAARKELPPHVYSLYHVLLSNDAQPRCMQITFRVNVALGGGALSVTATQCAVN